MIAFAIFRAHETYAIKSRHQTISGSLDFQARFIVYIFTSREVRTVAQDEGATATSAGWNSSLVAATWVSPLLFAISIRSAARRPAAENRAF